MPELEGVFADQLRQLGKDPPLLIPFRKFKFTYLIVELDHGQRLYKERGTRCRLIVNHGLDLTLELSAQRYHIPAVALCDDRFLQFVAGFSQVPLKTGQQPVARNLETTPNLAELRRGRVQYLGPI
jgi:hypothetical protein